MPPHEMCDLFMRWRDSSRSAALAVVEAGVVREGNARFAALEAGGGPWRWMNGPHARVRYATLSELLRGEAATLAPVPYLARYQRGNQVIEVRLERLESGEAVALDHLVAPLVAGQVGHRGE